MAANFKALLSVPLDKVERPKTLPGGTWYGLVKAYEFGESSEKKTPFVRYQITIQRPGEDIAPEELEGVDLQKLRTLRSDFYLTEDALFRLKDFLESCGVTTTGRTLAEALPDSMSAEVICAVTQTPAKNRDGSAMLDSAGNQEYFNNIDRMRGTHGQD